MEIRLTNNYTLDNFNEDIYKLEYKPKDQVIINEKLTIKIEFIKYFDKVYENNHKFFNEIYPKVLNNNIYLVCQLNTKEIIKGLKNKTFEDDLQNYNYFLKVINTTALTLLPPLDKLTTNIFEEVVSYDIKVCQKYSTKLYKYQIENITWMLDLEMKVHNNKNEFTVANMLIKKIDENLYYDIEKSKFQLEKKNTKVKFYGGILIDEMGLGKTLTSIMLCLSNRISENIIPEIYNKKIKSKGTLILVPNTIMKQWVDEIEKYNNTSQKLKIILLNGKQHMIRGITPVHTYDDYINCDFLIVNHRIFQNKFFIETFNDKEYKNFEELNSFPRIHDFYWRRIIIDEAHELMGTSESSFQNYVITLKSIYKWCLTGTPFNNDNNITNYKQFILNNFPSNRQIHQNLEGIKLFRKNTKASTEQEIKLKQFKIKEEIHQINFIPIERQIYINQREDILSLRKFCCSPFEISGELNIKTFEEYLEFLKNNNNQLIEQLTNELIIMKDELKEFKKDLKKYNKQLENYNKQEIKLKNLISLKEYNKNLEQILLSSEEIECVICLDEIQNMTITLCGHIFCDECIIGVTNSLCPTCRKPMEKKDLIRIQKIKAKTNINDENIKKYGSKITYIINWIKDILQNENNRILLFVEWTDVLYLIKKVLDELNIQNIICKGTSVQRSNAIHKFNTTDCRIIMLSSKYSCSGSNLTKANYIGIINPIGGTAQQRIATESQAIARVNRIGQKHDLTVSRFIIKNTIEEDLYNESKINLNEN